MTVTICVTGYSARVGGKSLGVYPNEWEAVEQVDGKALLRTKPAKVTVRLWLSGWRALFPGERDARTRETEHYMLRPFSVVYGDRVIADITPMEAQAWALEHPAQVRWLRMAWSKAFLMGAVSFNPWRFVELRRRAKPQRRPPTREELATAIAECERRGGWWLEFRDMVLVAAHSGARMGGLVSLRREGVDMEARRMTVTEKGGKTRSIVLFDPAVDALVRSLPRHAGPLVFLARTAQRGARGFEARRPPLDKDLVASAWREVRGDYPFTFHCLKHYAATWMLERGADEKAVAIQLGHFDAQGRPYTDLIRRVYEHPDHGLALERLEKAVAA